MKIVNCSCDVKHVLLTYLAAKYLTAKAGHQTGARGEPIGVSRESDPCDGLDGKCKKQQDPYGHCHIAFSQTFILYPFSPVISKKHNRFLDWRHNLN